MFIIPEFGSTDMKNIETYNGSVITSRDALLLLEATRLGILPRVKRRLNGLERKYIRPNTVFAWNETECGMQRWTDGKNWSPSKVSGPFLIYRELDEYKNVKPDSLIKQSFSVITKQNQKLHLISYYIPGSQNHYSSPSKNQNLSSLKLTLHIYPEHLIDFKDFDVYEPSSDSSMMNDRYSPHRASIQYTTDYSPHRASMQYAPEYFSHYTMQYNPSAPPVPPAPPAPVASASYPPVPSPQFMPFTQQYGFTHSPAISPSPMRMSISQYQPQISAPKSHPHIGTMFIDKNIKNEYSPPRESTPRAFQPPPLPHHRVPYNYNRDDKYALNVLDKGFSTTV